VADFKLEVMDIKKKFDGRVEDFKKQMTDYQKNNDALEELKKAH
jgi:hypothetical protein